MNELCILNALETYCLLLKKDQNEALFDPKRIYYSACLFSYAAIFYWQTNGIMEWKRSLTRTHGSEVDLAGYLIDGSPSTTKCLLIKPL